MSRCLLGFASKAQVATLLYVQGRKRLLLFAWLLAYVSMQYGVTSPCYVTLRSVWSPDLLVCPGCHTVWLARVDSCVGSGPVGSPKTLSRSHPPAAHI